MNTIMRKVYIAPQMEVMQFSSEVIMDSIGIVHHSGGGGGFGEGSEIW
jgi:hypothetical protein